MTAIDKARVYFAFQVVAGALWWVGVFASDDLRTWTLGDWEPAVLVVPDVLLFVVGSALVAVTGNRYIAALVAVWTTAVTVALAVYGLVERTAGWGVVAMALATAGTVLAATTTWMRRLPLEWFFVGPFVFRVANEAPGSKHLRRSLAQLAVFWTTFFVIVPAALVVIETRLGLQWSRLDSGLFAVTGLVLFLAGSAVGLWSCVTISLAGAGTPLPAESARNLVATGPYRYVRNPMAVAGATQTVGVGLLCGSWMITTIALAGALTWNSMIRPSEEADLAARFGEPYRQYCDQVRCWIPRRNVAPAPARR